MSEGKTAMDKANESAAMRDPNPAGVMLRIADGQFDDLPGGPWRTPPFVDYSGITTAVLAANHVLGGRGGTVNESFFGIDLMFRHFGIQAHDTELKHVIQIIGDEFELLVLLDLGITSVLMACRGNKDAVVGVAETLVAGYADGFEMASRPRP